MGRITLLALFFCGLGAFAIWKIQNPDKVEDTFANSLHTQFALEDVNQIQRVFLADRAGNQALLERNEDLDWTYTNKSNQKQFRAHPSAIYTLLETIKKIRTREPVAKSAVPNVVKSLAAKATKVEIYDKNNNKLRVYYVGTMASGATGNYMIMEGSERPYVIYIPNFQGTIDTRFMVREEDWRDKAVFRVKPEDLEFVQVEYQAPNQQFESFKIAKEGDRYNVTPLSPDAPNVYSIDQVNQDNADTYFQDFDVLGAEKIIYNKEQRDTVITSTPFAIISYKTNYHNEPQTFRLYSIYNPNADRGDGQVGHRQKIQRYFIDIDEDHFYLGQHLVIRKLLWGYSFFFQKEAVQLVEDEAATKQNFPDNKELEREEREKRREAAESGN